MPATLKQLVKEGFSDSRTPRTGEATIFRNLKDGNLYHIYLISPRMYTGSWLVAERMFYSQGITRKIPESHLKDYVFVGYR
jgi:hypothetical protein